MPKMTKYQLEHFERKVERTLNPLIDEQELLVKQYTTEATDKASKKLAVKIGAQKIIDALKSAEEMLAQAQKSAQSFFEKKATNKQMKEDLNSKFDRGYSGGRYDDDKITLSDCNDQIRTWAKALAEREIEKRPEGKELARLKGIKRSALDSIMESEAPTTLIEALNKQMTKYLGVSWHEKPKAIEQ
jgi:sugar-specific transcriptional regulator TrmB